MTITLNKPFAGNMPVDAQDVRAIKRALNWLGYYTPYKKTGMTDFPDTDVFSALKTFQHEHNISATGQARPDDETIEALNKALSTKMKGQP